LLSIMLTSCCYSLHSPPIPTFLPYTTLFRSLRERGSRRDSHRSGGAHDQRRRHRWGHPPGAVGRPGQPGCESLRQRSAHGECDRSEEHTSELQSRVDLVCSLMLEKKIHKILI